MRITILYDNEVYKRELESSWGFSCLVEVENAPRILFDTGANGAMLLRNMAKLHIEPMSIAEVFISHAHRDHTGGLSDFLQVNETATVYVPSSFSKPSGAKEVVSVKEPCEIHENIFSTGELSRLEQSLVVKMEKGLVVVAGCSHPGVGSILEAASEFGKGSIRKLLNLKVYALIGGLHGFREFDKVKDLELICPAHCTQYKSKIKSLYPEKCINGGAGRIIEL